MFKILSYLGIILLTFTFTYIFDNNENYTLLYMLLILPIIDYLLYIYNKKNLELSFKIDNEYIEKREDIVCQIEFINNGIIPILFVEYEISFNSKFYCDDNLNGRVSIGCKKSLYKELSLKSIHRGNGEVSISSINLISLFGLFTHHVNVEEFKENITITPALIEIDGINKIKQFGIEDNEDISTNNLCAGSPGFEYKEYCEGDPLNRVNWKLSSKTDKIFVRKSLLDIKRKKKIILDPLIQDDKNIEEVGDLFIEGLLGLAKELYTLDYDVEINIIDNKRLYKTAYENKEIFISLVNKLSSYSFNSMFKGRFTSCIIEEGSSCDVIIFTSNKDSELKEFISKLEYLGHDIVVIRNSMDKVHNNELLLSKEYSLEVI